MITFSEFFTESSTFKRVGASFEIEPDLVHHVANTGYERWPTAGAMHRVPTDGPEHLAFKCRGVIHCARADGPQPVDKLIDT